MPAEPTKRRAGPKKVSFIGTYVPRRCGIATFSNDLLTALRTEAPASEWWSVALNDGAEDYDYPPEVHFEIEQKSLADYRKAVDFLNMNQVDAVSLQHEFGIYGGGSGSYVLRPLEYLRMPVVSTLHTVLKEPSREQAEIMNGIGDFSDRVVVMSEMARDVLTSTYRIDKNRVTVIPHGVPDLPFLDPSYNKDQFGLVGKKLILTFGLLSQGKGLEYVIEALPAIVKAHPDAIFAILGATHPEVRRREGEAYRLMLQHRARELGVADNVVFYNQFIDNPTLISFLSAADVVVTPYLGREQIVSGVLSYALGAGKAIVSTPYWYAEEMLADNHGVLVPFRDAEATGAAIIRLLSDDVERNAMRKRAYLKARPMVWSEVAGQYLRVFREVRRERALRPRSYRIKTLQTTTLELPYPRLDHLKILTDGTGILQHARFDIPDRDHGYCTDDNARALIVSLQAQHVLTEKDNVSGGLSHTYLSFLQHAFNPSNGRFRNFMGYDRQWREDLGSEDSHGRAMWALGQTVLDSPLHGMASAAMTLFNLALPRAVELKPLRAIAYTLLGVEAYLRRFNGATEIRRAQAVLAERLLSAFTRHGTPEWPWPEDQLTYANGLLPNALIASAARLENDEMLKTGLASLAWLNSLQTDPKGHFVPIGSNGWYNRNGTRARFDQQPIEIQHMADACLEALRVTGEPHWLDDARRCFEWFLGRNDLGQPVCDHSTGGCRDGLQPEGLNYNQGAESTLAWLHSLIAMHLATGAASASVTELTPAARQPAKGPSPTRAPTARIVGDRAAGANTH